MTSLIGEEASADRSSELARAVASLLGQDPSRILALAVSLKGQDRAVESTVVGGSMGPTLPQGSRIRIAMGLRNDYRIGEVVAILIEARMVVHRVVRCGRSGRACGYLLTRGDATLVPDPPHPVKHVVGEVAGVWRDGGWREVDRRFPRSVRARALSFAIETAMSALLCLSPRAAGVLAALLWSCLHRLRSADRAGKPMPPSAARD